MDPVITIVLVVAAAAAQVNAMACNLSHKNGTHHCYGALGESLSLHLAADSSNEEIQLKKDFTRILHFKTGEDWKSKLHQDYVNRSEFFNNGTLRWDRVIEEDSGDYQLEIHNSEGKLVRKVNMLLEIQAPVSEPVLSHLCLPHGETVVTCSSDRDGLQYSWTLNGQNLTRSLAYDHYQNSVITLKSDVTGTLTCMVQNKVNSSNSTIDLSLACPVVSSQFPSVAVTVSVALTVGTLTLLALFVGINHLCKKQRSRFDNSERCDEVVVYADVKINQARKQRPPDTETVVYGQIKMAVNPDVAGSP
ncbi:hepatocyte cell adhesion molecule-like [Oncorhynchus tshawytscha]|uniref:hepatocyte cell adhesion molecule-like n=1 Tax=Oncorhynchus tshawytscha TaxID=74940 RepID=UPI000D0A30B4|nr:hepatocyte cell adhesion molecule-like [Oncorhynchus tshawytscha]